MTRRGRSFEPAGRDLLCVLAPVDELSELLATLKQQQKQIAAMDIQDAAGRHAIRRVQALLARPRRVAPLGDVVGK